MKKKQNGSCMQRILMSLGLIVSGAVIALVGLYIYRKSQQTTVPIAENSGGNTPIISNHASVTVETLEEMVADAGELVSLNYYYTNASTIEKHKEWFNKYKVPFSTSQVIFTYDGTVKGGIDLTKIDYQIDESDRSVVLTLPPPKILSHEVDYKSFQFFVVKSSLFTEIPMQVYISSLDELKDATSNKLLQKEDFFEQVNANAQRVLENLLRSSQYGSDYRFRVVTTKAKITETAEAATDSGTTVSTETTPPATSMIAMPASAFSLRGDNYSAVVNQLKEAGFTNIELEEKKTMKNEWFSKSGDITAITVNGNGSFKKGDTFPSDAHIHITYDTLA